METLNFTQFCAQNGFTDDYSVLDHAALSPSGYMSDREHDRQMKLHLERSESNKQAHEQFYNAIKGGIILDASGELKKESIIRMEEGERIKAIDSKINIIKGKIQFIESLGAMSHLKNGNLKKGYKAQVDYYQQQINDLML